MIPFDIPLKYAQGLADGSLQRIGTIIKDDATGRIVGHVQETGLTSKLLEGFIGSPFSPLQTISSMGANFQLAHITNLLNIMKTLQYFNIGVSVIGIGVSAIGFVMMNQKLNKMQNSLDKLSNEVAIGFAELHSTRLREHFSNVAGLVEQAEQAYHLSKPEKEWLLISSLLANESAFFRGELEHYLKLNSFSEDIFYPLLQSFMTCSSARVECLMLAGEIGSAKEVAANHSKDCRQMFEPLTPSSLANKSLNVEVSDYQITYQLTKKIKETSLIINGLRDITDASSTKPLLLDYLIAKGINGREYIESINNNENEPILILPVS